MSYFSAPMPNIMNSFWSLFFKKNIFLHAISSMTPIFAEMEWNGETTDRQSAVCYVYIPHNNELRICLDIGLLQN